MTILNRPLFRQAGGPIQPEPMMAPPMDPAMDPMMQAVGDAEMQGAQIGEQYMADTMQNLDMAESPKEVIDAIRGNARPLEARYQELATFVGEEDALQTPESVLAMVQPTIMMSEEGAMDTGIAELMQGMMGDVEMAPGSEMAEGVGSLMMAGASEAPAPQNFNQGGAVRLQEGGDVGILQALMSAAQPPKAETVKGYYESLLPMYQEILGRDEEAREASRAAGFFDIAQAGLNLASGIDPRTGRSTAGQSFASQLASAASGLPERFAERAAEERRAEQALRASALQTAMQQAQGSQDFQQQLSLLAAKEAFDTGAGKAAMPVFMYNEQGDSVDIDKSQGVVGFSRDMAAARAAGYTLTSAPDESSLYGSRSAGLARARSVEDPNFESNLFKGIFLGENTSETRLAQNDLLEMMKPEEGSTVPGKVTPNLQIFASLLQPGSENIRREVQAKFAENPNVVVEDLTQVQNALGQAEKIVQDVMLGNRSGNETSQDIELLVKDLTNTDLEDATGGPSLITNAVETIAQQFMDFMGSDVQTKLLQDSQEARRLLETYGIMAEQYFFQAPEVDRPLAAQYDRVIDRFPQPTAGELDANAMKRVENLATVFRSQAAQYRDILRNPSLAAGRTLDTSRKRLRQAELLAELSEAMVRNYKYGPSGVNIPGVASDSPKLNVPGGGDLSRFDIYKR